MKTKHFLPLLVLLMTTLSSHAYNFKSGDLYYNITSDTTVAVTYQRLESSNNYLGLTIADIPDSVTYNSKTYSVTSIDNIAFYWCSTLNTVNIGNNVTRIGSDAFWECISLQNINISSSVERIEEGAFGGCSGLNNISIPQNVAYIGGDAFTGTRWFDIQPKGIVYINNMVYAYKDTMPDNSVITIPEGITSICGRAFNSCSGLVSISIPNSVTSIGEGAFQGCTNLSVITIPENITTIESGTFRRCSSLTSITISSNTTIIGNYAFEYCSALTSITLPNSVTSIGEGAFQGCTNLSVITIPENITSIESSTFSGCSSLNTISIPNTITNIGYEAFNNCTSLASVNIPNSVTSIGGYAFQNVFHIAYNGTATGAPWGAKFMNKYIDGMLLYESEAKQKILRCISTATGNIVVPNSVRYISDESFKDCSEIRSIQLPYYVETIGEYAFQGCTALETCLFIKEENTQLPSKKTHNEMLSEIRDTVFFINTKNWTNIHVHAWGGNAEGTTWPGILAEKDTLQWNGYDVYFFVANPGDYAYCIFNNGGNGSQTADLMWNAGKYYYKTFWIVPNEHFTEIGAYAFEGCTDLSTINLPEQVKSIGSNAFQNCSSLVNIDIPDGVTRIEHNMFSNCSHLTSVNYSDGITSIGYRAFDGCSSLTSITIPNTVTSIGSSAFSGCSSLTSVVWNAKNCGGWSSSSYVPFYDISSNITSFTFGEEVETIPSYLCYGMSSLTSVTIPNSVTSIGAYAFRGCSSLTSVVWNAKKCEGWSSYDYGPFYSTMSNITSFTFGEEVETIPSYLCYGMSSLTFITIPNSVTSIGERAFGGCSSLTKLICEGHIEDMTNDVIRNCYALDTIVIAANAFDVLEGSWPSMPKNIRYIQLTGGEITDNAFNVILRNYKTLGTLDLAAATNTTLSDEAFKGCYNLQTLLLPAQLTSIPYMAVAECVNLQSIIIPATITDIEQRAFENCRSIQSITFEGATSPENGGASFAPAAETSALWRIGNWAFYNCHQLQHLTIPESVTEIGDAAFYGCTYLEDMTLPSTMRKIGDNTFALCSKLQKIHVLALVPPTICTKTFYDVNRAIPVYVPDEAVEDYKSDTYWQEFNIIGESNAPTAIENALHTDTKGVQKLLRDGQVLILRNGETYDMMGQRL